jgi:beta-phosphoglucomutase
VIELDGILFDMDGVLLDSMGAHARAWMTALGEAGLHVDEEEIYLREGEQGEVSARDFLRRAGMMSTKARVRTLLERKEELFAARPDIRLFPGARETVGALAAAGVPLGVVTGTSRAEMERVLPAEIRGPLRVIVTGTDVLHGKPHPEPYLKGVMGLGIKPGRTLVVENAPYGIRSAVAAETVCLAIRSYLADEHLSGARYRIDRIADLLPFLRENAAGFAEI